VLSAGNGEAESPGVLVDSSLWVEFYRPSPRREVQDAILELLSEDRAFTTPLVMAEVIQRAPDDDTLETLVEDFSGLRQVPGGPEVGATAARIGHALRARGSPRPPADLLIAASAVTAGLELWHCGAHFAPIAEVVPLRTRGF